MMNQEIANSFNIAIQQKRAWKYRADNGLPEISVFSIHIYGKPDLEKLKQVIKDCTSDYEIFYQLYKQSKGFDFPLTQVGRHEENFLFEVVDDADENRIEKAVRAYKAGCPLSVFLVARGTETYDLELYLPAISLDKTSYRILFRNICEAFGAGPVEAADDEKIQFIDFSEWQNDILTEEAGQGRTFWNKIVNSDVPLALPYANASTSETFEYRHKQITLPQTLAGDLEKFALDKHANLQTCLLAAYNLHLYKLGTYFNDVITGIRLNGRSTEEVKDLYGFLDQFVPLTTTGIGAKHFSQLLHDTAAGVEEVVKWQFFYTPEPFAEKNRVKKEYLPFLFDYEELVVSCTVDGLVFSQPSTFGHFHDYDLLLHIIKDLTDGEITLHIGYNANRYDEIYIDLFIAQYTELLTSLLENSFVPAAEISCASKEEIEKVCTVFNQPAHTFEDGNCLLHELFEKQVALFPGNIAVVQNGIQLTYEVLNNKANAIAARLTEKGIGGNEVVALLTERSADTIVGMLGILKAGAVYLPISATYQPERIAAMLESAQVKTIVLQEKLAASLQDQKAYDLLFLDKPEPAINSGKVVVPNVTPDDMAYVIFTSGSTGKPKGCTLSHGNIVNYISAINCTVLTDKTVGSFPFFTPISFDFTLTGLLGSLMNGKTVHVFGEYEDISDILRKCFNDETGIDAIKLTPSHILMLDHIPVVSSKIKLVMSGGEALAPQHIEIVRRKAPHARIVNHYGPTETTVGCLTYAVEDDKRVCVGKPLTNVAAYITDANGKLSPVGIPGEIWIGGKGVSPGYLNAPELNAEKFITVLGMGRVYKTGDIGRWLPDGNIEYFGRRDNQVKIRGNRVETGEVEEAIRSHPAIDKVVVLADKDNNGNNILVAFYISNDKTEVLRAELEQFLLCTLPDYMIPAFFVRVNSFPANKNGKLDTKALLISNYREHSGKMYVAPQNETQQVLAGIWKEVLAIENIGIRHNFFELGGHSLLAMQLISRIREAFGVEVQVGAIFRYPTIETLQQHIDSAELTKQHIPAFVKLHKDAEIPMSFGQRRLWFLYQLDPSSTMYNMPSAMKLFGHYSVAAFKQSFDALCRKHAILRTTFTSKYDKFLQVVHPEPFDNYFSVEDLSGYTELQFQARLAEMNKEECNRVFDLEKGPLLQVRLVKINEQSAYLFFNMHHIVMDEWSMGILTEDLAACYNAFISGSEYVLQENEFSYADFSAWQALLLEQVGDKQLAYWEQKLNNITPFLDLPFAKPRLVKDSYAGNVIPFAIDKKLSADIKQLGQAQQASLFMTLYSALAVLLHKYTGNTDLLIGTPVANRHYKELEKQLGFFVNTIVLRAGLKKESTFRDVLKEAVHETIQSFSNQDYPFEKIVEKIKPERKPGYSPIFQALFAVHNGGAIKPQFEGITMEDVSISERQAKFDIVLSVDDNDSLSGYLEYNAELFDETDMQRFNVHFTRILELVVQNPGIRIADIELVSAEERIDILRQSYPLVVTYPEDSVMTMIEKQAMLQPSAIALAHNDKQLTFQQLNEASNKLAAHLSGKLHPGNIAAVCLERSADLIVYLLAILKTGAAYLAIDPAYPNERKQYMLKDAAASLIITDKAHGHIFSMENVIVALHEQLQQLNDIDVERPATAHNPLAPAYIIYTSGSTGQPKGMTIHHKALQNLVHWHNNTFALTNKDITTQVAGISFDASVWEIWPTLCAGATLHIIDQEQLLDLPAMQVTIIAKGITICFWPTPLAEHMFALDWPQNISLRQVLIGGDTFRRRIGKSLPFDVIENYGLSEACVVSTSGKIDADAATVVTIGKPIANTCVLILDEHMQLVPTGVCGELYIAGEGLALNGYINNPQQTADRFIPNPFKEIPYSILYKTGDTGSYTHSGEIRYMGRTDRQVKIRGHRIEVSEIEAEILKHPNVLNVVVINRYKEDTSDNYLVALYTVKEHGVSLANELQQMLKLRLPAYQVPASMVLVPEIPVNVNGKVNIAALHGYVTDKPAMEQKEMVTVLTPVQEKLATIWSELLTTNTINKDGGFFEMGGHSLLITMLKSRVRETFGLDLPIRFFFDNTTLFKMASGIEQSLKDQKNTTAVNTIGRVSRKHYKI